MLQTVSGGSGGIVPSEPKNCYASIDGREKRGNQIIQGWNENKERTGGREGRNRIEEREERNRIGERKRMEWELGETVRKRKHLLVTSIPLLDQKLDVRPVLFQLVK